MNDGDIVGRKVGNMCFSTWFGNTDAEACRVLAIDDDPTYVHGKKYTIEQMYAAPGCEKQKAKVAVQWVLLQSAKEVKK